MSEPTRQVDHTFNNLINDPSTTDEEKQWLREFRSEWAENEAKIIKIGKYIKQLEENENNIDTGF